jgi:hypothetical protein
MRTYWDSSALIVVLHTPALLAKLDPANDATRPHTLAELFSTLTKGVNFRYSPQDAANVISSLATSLTFIELSKEDGLSAIKDAQRLAVRGARIHDLMHARAARKFDAEVLMTLDTAGFSNLTSDFEIRAP